MLRPLRHYADFSGRSRRAEFWLWYLVVMAALVALMYLDTLLGLGGTTTGTSYATANGAGFSFNMTGGVLTFVGLAAILVPNVAVAVRRLHDVGKSALVLLFILIPLFGWAYLLYLYVQPGTPGPNPFGPDPRGGEVAARAAPH